MRKNSRTPVEQRFWQYVNKTNDCWLWTGATRHFGYGVINMGGHNGHAERAHRLSWIMHNGEIPKDLCVCHKCDNPSCVNPNHLFLGTRADNNHDMQKKGRCDTVKRPKGEQSGNAKLKTEQVLQIRDRYSNGETLSALAKEYPVSVQTIFRIVNRTIWKHI